MARTPPRGVRRTQARLGADRDRALAFAFVCWDIGAASSRGRLATPLLAFALVLLVAAGVFTMVRLVGPLVLVERMGRTRRSARGAHALTGLFLVAAGIAYLQQTPWVVSLYNWVLGR